jgi:hypothetical protein
LTDTFPIGPIRATLTTAQVHLQWPDGTSVQGCIGHSARYAHHTALELGYPNAAAMVLEHDLIHAAIEAWLGVDSAVMLRLRGLPSNAALETLEEQMVLAMQRYMRAAGVNLMERLKD